jgi:hypothetical protein
VLDEAFGKFGLLAVLAWMLLSSLSVCQAQSTAEQTPTLRTRSNVVLAPALVKDKAGKLVFGLQTKDFIIEDDGVSSRSAWTKRSPTRPFLL